jgi:protein TonB
MATVLSTHRFIHSSPHVDARIRTDYSATIISGVLGAILFVSVHGTAAAQMASRNVARNDIAVQKTWYDSNEDYKRAAAKHVVRKNKANTFTGRLPPMLPAVVVLNITVDETGRTIEVSVQRSLDDEATAVAIASIYHAGSLPSPRNLVAGPGRSLTYSETFLFNADYRFQIRTLAPRQGSE